MGANTKDGAELTGLLLARRRRRNSADLLARAAPNDAAPTVFGDWLFDAAASDAGITGAGQIASAEAIGSHGVAAGVDAAGVATGEAFGSAGVAAAIVCAGVATAEAFGQPALGAAAAEIVATGVESGEAIGGPSMEPWIFQTGVAGDEQFGQPALSVSGGEEPAVSGGGSPAGRKARKKPRLIFRDIPADEPEEIEQLPEFDLEALLEKLDRVRDAKIQAEEAIIAAKTTQTIQKAREQYVWTQRDEKRILATLEELDIVMIASLIL